MIPYVKELAKSVADKQWFINDTYSCDVFIDYGCADGTLIKYLAIKYPYKKFVGYDSNPEMMRLATENCKDIPNVYFYYHPLELLKFKTSTCLILSSILHEVYHYLDTDNLFLFWEFVNKLNPDYIAIRDMFARSFPTDNKIIRYCSIVRSNADKKQLQDFEYKWGLINNIRTLTHFLLKYKYVDNWEREVSENYLSYNLYDIVEQLPNHQLVSEHVYTLPYLRGQILKDFRIDFGQYATHRQILFKR